METTKSLCEEYEKRVTDLALLCEEDAERYNRVVGSASTFLGALQSRIANRLYAYLSFQDEIGETCVSPNESILSLEYIESELNPMLERFRARQHMINVGLDKEVNLIHYSADVGELIDMIANDRLFINDSYYYETYGDIDGAF